MTGFDGLAAVGGDGLLRLADLFEAGVLALPTTALALREHVADQHARAVAQCLGELPLANATPMQAALLLRACAAGTRIAAVSPVPVDVVVSGPDATGGARDTGVVMRQLFGKARSRALAVGFAVHQGKSVFKTLADRLDDEPLEATLCVDVRRPHGDTSLDREIVQRFASQFVRDQWPGTRLPTVYYDPRSVAPVSRAASAMHAKCVVIDGQEALVTSANFTEAAQVRNIELGLLVDSPTIARRIEDHFASLIRDGVLERLPLR